MHKAHKRVLHVLAHVPASALLVAIGACEVARQCGTDSEHESVGAVARKRRRMPQRFHLVACSKETRTEQAFCERALRHAQRRHIQPVGDGAQERAFARRKIVQDPEVKLRVLYNAVKARILQ